MNSIVTDWITCDGGMPAFIAVPEAALDAPAIVLMHERYGLVSHTTDLAERFARANYVCIAPDCFFKHPDQAALHRGDVGYDMTDAEAVEYLAAALAAVKRATQADASRIAVMGVCQTGRHPLVLAAQIPIAAALVWYGACQPREWEVSRKYPVPLDDIIGRIACPVLGMFGETDHLISVSDVRRLRDRLERHGKSFRIHLYPGAPHGWLNDTMPGRYRRAQAEASWQDQLDFLATVLAPDYDRKRIVQSCALDMSVDYDFTKHVRYE
jgi:carboxymethylenebutenolidase